MDGGFFGLSWDAVWMANLNLGFSFATLSPTSSAHPVCHAPANREGGLGSETNITKTLWLKILWWSWVEQGIVQWGIADRAGTGDRSTAWKAASLSSGVLTYAHFSELACLQRTLSPEILRKKFQTPQDSKLHQKVYELCTSPCNFHLSNFPLCWSLSSSKAIMKRAPTFPAKLWNAVKEIFEFSFRKKYPYMEKSILLRK